MSTPGGRYDFDDGGSYCGGWEAGKAHGHGVCTGPKGQGEYCGMWANGFEACGVYVWPSGNTFEGQWQQGKRHGLGVERRDAWTYQGEWTQGFKGRYGVRLSSVTGAKYEGTWASGLQDGYGCETYADGGTYHGQWQRGTRHGYGVRQSVPYGIAARQQMAKVMHSSQQSLQHGNEEEEDKVVQARDRKLTETRGGFILTSKSDTSANQQLPQQQRSGSRLMALFEKPARSMKRSLKAAGAKLRKQRSANDVSSGEGGSGDSGGGDSSSLRSGKLSVSMRSTRSFASQKSTTSSVASTLASKASSLDDDRSFYSQDDIADASVTERYSGEWNGDKRCGFGVSERSDGLRYEGEWYSNRKHGYGTTTHKDGSSEAGKYKNNVLVSSMSAAKVRLLIVQRNKLTERVADSVEAARRAAQLAVQKAEVAASRMASARSKAELAVASADMARQDSFKARSIASQLDPKFHQPGVAILRKKQQENAGSSQAAGVGGLPLATLQQTTGYPDCRFNGAASGSGASSPEFTIPKHIFQSGRTPTSSSPEASVRHGFWRDQLLQPIAQTAAIGTLGKLTAAVNPAMLVDHFDHYETSTRIPNGSGGTAATAVGAAVHHHQRRPERMATRLSDNSARGGSASENGYEGSGATAAAALPAQSQLVPAAVPGAGSGSRLPRSQSGGGGGGSGVTFGPGGDVPAAAQVARSDRLVQKAVGCSAAPLPPALAHRSKDDASLLASRAAAVRSDSPLKVNGGAAPALAAGTLATGKVSGVGMATLSSSRKQRGSLPDVSIIRDMSALSKEEVQKLSAERRVEIRKLLDEHERRRRGDVSVLVDDMKKWLDQRKLLMLVLAINVGVIGFLLKWWL